MHMHLQNHEASHPFQHTALTQLMNRSVSSNYLSPCFVPTQIFVATIAFLLPGAEHSTVEADKKVCVGKEGDVKRLRSKKPLIYHVGMVSLQRNVSIVSLQLSSLNCCSLELCSSFLL